MEFTITPQLLQRLNIADGAEYNPVPFVAQDVVDFGAASTALAGPYPLFSTQDKKSKFFRTFVWNENPQAIVITHATFLHNVHFTAIGSGTTDMPLLQDAFEKLSYIEFGLNDKPIFNIPVWEAVPWTRGANALTVSMLEKENTWVRLPYALEVPVRCVGSTSLYVPPGFTTGAGGSSNADTPYLPNYPTAIVGGSGNNASNLHSYGIFAFKGIKFVKV